MNLVKDIMAERKPATGSDVGEEGEVGELGEEAEEGVRGCNTLQYSSLCTVPTANLMLCIFDTLHKGINLEKNGRHYMARVTRAN